MSNRYFATVLFIVGLCSTLAAATTKSAIAIIVGDVTVNGAAVAKSSAVIEGDRLNIGHNSAAVLHLSGATIQVAADSGVRFVGEQLELDHGTVEIAGREDVRAGPFQFRPSRTARFMVERSERRTTLTLNSGLVTLKRGKETLKIQSRGQHIFIDDGPLTTGGTSQSWKRSALAGAAGGASGSALASLMEHGKKAGISKASPAHP